MKKRIKREKYVVIKEKKKKKCTKINPEPPCILGYKPEDGKVYVVIKMQK